MGVAGLHDSYLMFLMPFAPSICFERVFYIKFVKEDLCKMGVAGLHDSYLMFLMPFAPSICFERVFYIKFVKEDFSETEY